MRAQSVRAARAAIRDFVAPSLMVTLADRRSIAMQMAGAAPARSADHTSQGVIPSAGWLAANDWRGVRPFESNPWVLDPPGGIVANTNNKVTDAAFPDHLSFDWGDSHRIVRATRLLNARAYHTLPSFIEIQTDTVSEAARTLLPLIARDLWYSGEPAAEGTADRRRQTALERLANWTGEMSEHTPEPLIYAAWVRALQRRLIVDELGPLADDLPAPDPVFLERVVPQPRRRRGLVRRDPEHRRGDLRRDRPARARRRAAGARGPVRAAAGELALGRRAPGAAPPPDARRHPGAAPPGQHPPVDARRRRHAAARHDAGGGARALPQPARLGAARGL